MKLTSIPWDNARKILSTHHGELLKRLEAMGSFGVSTIEYPYGAPILKQGVIEIEAGEKPYAFGLVLQGGLEVYLERDGGEKIITVAMLKPGNLLFLDKALENSIFPLSMQNISAGARSIFLLPKIGNSDRFWRLARRNQISLDLPNSLFQQWPIFKALASVRQSTWRTKIMLFSTGWLHQQTSVELIQYLKSLAIPTPQLALHQQELDIAIHRLIEERADIYSGRVLKNVLSIANGDLPGFVLADDETFAPVSLIQKAFIEDYGVKTAELIHPGYVQPGAECFYSFELHEKRDLHIDLNHKPSQSSIHVLEETQRFYMKFLERTASPINLDFLHAFSNEHILSKPAQPKDMSSPYSPFLRKGCIAISPDAIGL